MFDGAAVATVDSVATEQLAQSQAESLVSPDDVTTSDTPPTAPSGEPQFNATDQALFDALAAYDTSAARQEIVFLSPSVRDYQQLLDGMSPNVEVHVLDPTRDGVEQMADVLAGRTGIDAMHLIAEGNEAQLHLGTSFLTQDSISTQYAEQFQQIGQSLSADADVLIYGCNFGRGDAGQLAMSTLATLTGADVAASTDQTGHVLQLGDWTLEASTGTIETAIVVDTETQTTWEGLLTADNTAVLSGMEEQQPQNEVRRELVILDPGVQNSASLRDLLFAQQESGRDVDLVVLDGARDGVEQMVEILSRYHDLDAVHVLSHGTAQGLRLGNTWLDAQTVNGYAEVIRGWQGAFSTNGDLLLYGCDLAASNAGRALVDTLGQWTGTDVAASTDLTGYALFGGDWDLEYQTGSIETGDVADLDTQHDWVGLMSVAVDATSTGSGNNVTSVTVSHTTTSASDRLLLVGVSMDSTGGRTVTGVTYAGQSLTLVGAQSGGANPVRVEIWRLVNPPSGTANVVVNLSGSTDGVSVGATTFTGVDQTTPLGTFASAIGTSASPSVNVTSAAGELVYDVVAGKDATSLTQGANQTEQWELANSGGDQRGAASTEAGASTVTMSWSKTTSGTAEWAIGAVSIKSFGDTTLTQRVAAASDDAEEEGPTGTTPNRMWLNSSDIELISDFESPTTGEQKVGLRFAGLNIPVGATITSAHLVFRAVAADSPMTNSDATSLTLKGQLIGDAPTFTTTSGNISSRTLTSASTAWTPTTWTTGLDYNSPDISSVVQEIVGQGTWASGNDLAIIITGTGHRASQAYDTNPSTAAQLVVTYTTSGGSVDNTGVAVWRENGTTTPEYNLFDGTSFGTEGNSANVGQWEVMQGAEAPTRDEAIVVGIQGDKTITGQMWNGSTWSALSINDLGSAKNSDSWSFDVAYELQSGDAVLVWNDSPNLKFSVWNGSSWTVPAVVAAYTGGDPVAMELAASPDSDEMVLVITDDSGDDYALAWNGTSWGNQVLLNTVNSQDETDISVTYEQTSGDAMVVYAKDTVDVHYRTWNGSSWSGEGTITAPAGPAGKARWTAMDSDPNSDRIVLGVLTESKDTYFAIWDGTAWNAGDKLSATIDNSERTMQNMAVAFESQSGNVLVTYGESSDTTVRYRTWSSGGGWSGELTGPDLVDGDPRSMTLDADPISDNIMLSVVDQGNDLNYVLWNGSSWGTPSEQEINVGQDTGQPFVFLWDQDPNDIPVIANLGGDILAYTEGDGAVVIDQGSNAAVTDVDSSNFDTGTLTVSFTAGSDSAEDVLSIRNQGTGAGQIGVSGSNVTYQGVTIGTFTGGSSGTNLVITMNASATPTAVTALVQNITYENTDTAAPTTGARTVRYVLTDGDGGTSANYDTTVTVSGVNDAPTITNLSGDSLSYAEGDGEVVIEQGDNATVSDVDSANFDTGTLTVSFTAGSDSAEDVLAIRNQGTGAGQIGVSGANVTYQGVTIGTYTGGSSGSNLVITFNASAAPTAVTALVQNITYQDTDTNAPTTGARTVRYVLTDGDGGTSANYDTTVTVSGVNDAPNIIDATVAVDENSANATAVTNVSDSFTGTDFDRDGQAITYSITAGNTGGAFAIDGATGAITVANSAALDFETTPSFTLTVQASDGTLSDTAAITINLNNLNDNAPNIIDATVALDENSANATAVTNVSDSFTGTDFDRDGQAITYSITAGNTGGAFAIDGATGAITVANSAALDFETTPSFTLTVQASDGTLSDTAAITINLNNLNDNAPNIIDATVALDENSANATAVTNVSDSFTGTDFDRDGQAITYSITAGNTGGAFAIDGATGAITVANSAALDFETTPSFTLTVQASDGTLSDTAAITINLNNLNDNAPNIIDATVALDENSANATAVTNVSDSFTGTDFDRDGQAITYSITAGNTGGAFAIDGATGAITVANSAALDFETTPSFTLTVQASDGTLSDTAAITINLNNLNDNAPNIIDATVALDENSANATAVTNVSDSFTGTDFDRDGQAITYSITAGNTGGAFAIDGATGAITVANSAALDFETTPSFTLTVQASDGTLSDTAAITINLNNLNDNAPNIIDATVALDENSANATAVTNISDSFTGTDFDRDNQAITYSITAGNTGGAFAIDGATGAITVATSAALDFETTPSFTLTVQASDGTLSDTAAITINLNNLNDNAPNIVDATVAVDENSANATAVTNVSDSFTGTDFDRDNQAITYSITAGNTGGAFAIDVNTGAITVATSAALDFETTPSFTLTVQASDGTLSDTAAITINLNNLNDNAPNIIDATVALDENSANGTAVTNISDSFTGTDFDRDNQAITYSITAGNTGGAFAIDVNTGAITVATSAALDFETTPSFTLTVQASDGTLSDTAAITINLNNLNDNAPNIIDATVALDENSANATAVTNISDSFTGTDFDRDGQAITYSITAGNTGGAFAIDVNTGAITVATSAALDFETTPSFTLTVQASDGTLSDTAAITINLNNLNDNAPSIIDATVALDENSANATAVTNISDSFTGTDFDRDGQAITYSITAGNTGGAFAIDGATGAITVATSAALDFETTPSFTLTVQASDGTLSDTAAITINLNNLNDNAPNIVDATVAVDENSANGTAVTNISDSFTGTDFDRDNQAITYSITAGNTGGAFAIDVDTGAITVATSAALDFETTPSFTLTVQASDGTLSDTAAITINLNNLNDNAPSIIDATVALDENSANGTAVTNISDSFTGTDFDRDNQAITYSITAGNTGGAFAIDVDTGAITVATSAALDFETTPSFTLTVQASDGTLSDTAAITINLNNLNDNAPSIIDATVALDENSANGTAVTNISDSFTGTDFDRDNQAITYSITAGNTGGAFAIDVEYRGHHRGDQRGPGLRNHAELYPHRAGERRDPERYRGDHGEPEQPQRQRPLHHGCDRGPGREQRERDGGDQRERQLYGDRLRSGRRGAHLQHHGGQHGRGLCDQRGDGGHHGGDQRGIGLRNHAELYPDRAGQRRDPERYRGHHGQPEQPQRQRPEHCGRDRGPRREQRERDGGDQRERQLYGDRLRSGRRGAHLQHHGGQHGRGLCDQRGDGGHHGGDQRGIGLRNHAELYPDRAGQRRDPERYRGDHGQPEQPQRQRPQHCGRDRGPRREQRERDGGDQRERQLHGDRLRSGRRGHHLQHYGGQHGRGLCDQRGDGGHHGGEQCGIGLRNHAELYPDRAGQRRDPERYRGDHGQPEQPQRQRPQHCGRDRGPRREQRQRHGGDQRERQLHRDRLRPGRPSAHLQHYGGQHGRGLCDQRGDGRDHGGEQRGGGLRNHAELYPDRAGERRDPERYRCDHGESEQPQRGAGSGR